MKILTNKKYNELILKPLQSCFAQVDDDMLLRENGLLYAENKKLHSIIKEVREYVNTDKNCVPKHIKDYINNLLERGN